MWLIGAFFCIIIILHCVISLTAAWTQKANDFSCPEAHPQSRVDDEFPQSLNFTIPVRLMHFLVFYTAVHAPSSPFSPQGTAEEIKVRKASFWSGKNFFPYNGDKDVPTRFGNAAQFFSV